QRPGRRGAVVPGDRVLPGPPAARQGGVPAELQRRAARPAAEGDAAGLHPADVPLLRAPPEGQAGPRVDGEGRPVRRPREGKGAVEEAVPVVVVGKEVTPRLAADPTGPQWSPRRGDR